MFLKWFDCETIGFLDRNDVVCVPAFGGLLDATGQKMGAFAFYKCIASLAAHHGIFIPLDIEPAFSEANIFHYVILLGT